LIRTAIGHGLVRFAEGPRMTAQTPPDYTQTGRLLTIDTPLGKDVFLVERFSGQEMVNDLFQFQATIRAKRDDVTAQDIVGRNVTVWLDLDKGRRRGWNGLVTDLGEQSHSTRNLRMYSITMRPDLWLMSQRSNCRIWLNKTAVEVAQTLCSEHNIRNLDTSGVLNPPPADEMSVQWNETDLDYLLRRLQTVGIFYWIRQKDGVQTLVLANKANGWDNGADNGNGKTRLTFGAAEREHINSWQRGFAFIPGKRAGRDWNFQSPNQVPGYDVPSTIKLPRNDSYQLYEYPAGALDTRAAQDALTLRMQATEHSHQKIEATSTVRELAPGAKLTPHDIADPGSSYETVVVMTIEHDIVATTYATGGSPSDYRNRFTALPANLPATPHRNQSRPRIDGSLIGVIAGPQGEEIHCDEFGRVKLWWPWDRQAKKDGSDTKWIRVAQPWAGGGWGAQVIPRIGMEAIVCFENGDPDRPIVTALVPNPIQKVPYPLPGNKTRMVLKSKTHKGEGSNEMRFEDEKDHEEVYHHAQKDMNTIINNDSTNLTRRHDIQKIEGNRVEVVGQNKKAHVTNGYEKIVGGNFSVAVGPSHIQQSLAQPMANVTDQVGEAMKASFLPGSGGQGDGCMTLTVQKNHEDSAGTVRTIRAGERIEILCGGARAVLNQSGLIEIFGSAIRFHTG